MFNNFWIRLSSMNNHRHTKMGYKLTSCYIYFGSTICKQSYIKLILDMTIKNDDVLREEFIKRHGKRDASVVSNHMYIFV